MIIFFIKKGNFKMNNHELKRLALSAKNRLIGNKDRINAGLKTARTMPLSPNIKIKTISLDDNNFYNRVREVLERDALDPIREVMDQDYYRSLSAGMKEKYLLDVIEKFLSYKKRFDQEVSQKSVL